MTRARRRLNVSDMPWPRPLAPTLTDPDPAWSAGPTPRQLRLLRAFGYTMIALVAVATATTPPRPGLSGDGLMVSIGLALFCLAILSFRPWRALPRTSMSLNGFRARLGAILLASLILMAVQPKGAGVGGIYLVVVLATLRLPGREALAALVLAVGGSVLVDALFASHAGDRILNVVIGVIPWFLVISLVRRLREGQVEAEALVEELEATRDAHAEAAALEERGRLARDMHDVLAHSLSALSLQLEGARLLARDRGTDPAVTAAIERAHRLAADGLDESRRAIAALRGDDLPGPDRLPALAEAFAGSGAAPCTYTVCGEPRELTPEARLAVYRTAQEALTNVTRHARPERVELRLEYGEDGTELLVADHNGHGAAPPPVPGEDAGYGLTGMRERAALLGGRLDAGPTDDGFAVRLWLPAGGAAGT
jgi:signal transduction histidine kinase